MTMGRVFVAGLWKSVEFWEISGVEKKEVPARTKKRGHDLWAGPPSIAHPFRMFHPRLLIFLF